MSRRAIRVQCKILPKENKNRNERSNEVSQVFGRLPVIRGDRKSVRDRTIERRHKNNNVRESVAQRQNPRTSTFKNTLTSEVAKGTEGDSLRGHHRALFTLFLSLPH